MYADDGIRCVTVCPGLTQPDDAGVAQFRAAPGSERGNQTVDRIRGAYLRRADPDEVGQLVAQLVRGGDALLNGAVLTADSGFSAYR
jgi:NAD(P)-dependent dehydrogenase (short-subunit alcohol dehydrogenase family)